MAFTRVHHVGLVTGDMENARHILVDGFGLSVDEHRTPWPQGKPGYDGTTIVEFPVGELYYEMAKPNDTESEPAQLHRVGAGQSKLVTGGDTDVITAVAKVPGIADNRTVWIARTGGIKIARQWSQARRRRRRK